MKTKNHDERLTHDEERAKFEEWKHSGDRRARDRLVGASLWIVEALARRFRCSAADREDLVAEGSIALLHAMTRFDPDRGVRLATYAHSWVRAAMTKYLLRESNALGSLARARNAARERRIRRATTEGDGASFSDSAPKDVWLDSPLANAPRGLVDSLVAPGPCPETALDERRTRTDTSSRVGTILAALPATERTILLARYGSEGHDPASTETIASALGLSRERVRQLEERARQRANTIARGASEPSPRPGRAGLRAIEGGRDPRGDHARESTITCKRVAAPPTIVSA